MANNEEKVVLDNIELLEDEIQDWSALNKEQGLGTIDKSLPKREGKYFDFDGSTTQQKSLQESKVQMYLALLHIRSHHVKHVMAGVWFQSRQLALVPHAKGSFFKDIGHAHTYKMKQKFQGMWLSPLETVYLVERGSLVMYLANSNFENFVENDKTEFDYDELPRLLLSHIYSLALSLDLDLVDKYETYALLKRLGYLILARQEHEQKSQISVSHPVKIEPKSIWEALLKKLRWAAAEIASSIRSVIYSGRLHFLDYTLVFQSLKLISAHRPETRFRQTPALDPRYSIAFDVWKPFPTFSKKNPPRPDFQVGVVNVARVPFPSISVIKALWSQLIRDEPELGKSKNTGGKPKTQSKFVSKKEKRQKMESERDLKLSSNVRKRNDYLVHKDKLLKNGSSGVSIVLAVVDSGVINFSIFFETEFALSCSRHVLELELLEHRQDHGIVWNEKLN